MQRSIESGRTANRRRGRIALGLFAFLALPGCGGFGYVPFLPSSMPAAQEPQPEYPLLFSAPRDAEQKPPVLNEAEQKAMEERLKNLAATREKAMRRRIERGR